MAQSALLLVHLLGFAAFLGGAFAQQQLMKMSSAPGLPKPVRDAYEGLASSVSKKIELPGLFAQVLSGAITIAMTPVFLQQHWLHGKLTAVALLLVLAHMEMINASRIVKARTARGDAADEEIAARKKRHALLGTIGTVLVVAVVLFATVLRTVM